MPMSCTYDEACDHLEAAHAANPAQYGGTYMVHDIIEGEIFEVEITMASGTARMVWDS